MYAENYLDYPDAENSLAYQYAKGFLDHYERSGAISRSPVETEVSVYKRGDASLQQSELSYLLAESQGIRMAWDSLNLIAQDWLREGKPLPPKLVEWVVEVLADQLVKKKEQRRPRPRGGAQRLRDRDIVLCLLVGELRCLCDLNATRNAGDPPVSACDVVAAAIGRPYKTVERIWNKRDPDVNYLLSGLDKQSLMKRPFLSSRNL